VVIESLDAVIEVSDGSRESQAEVRSRGGNVYGGDELYAETVLKHSTRLVPRGAAAWSASLCNWLRSIIEEKERGWKEK
jgi:hypothetical protein